MKNLNQTNKISGQLTPNEDSVKKDMSRLTGVMNRLVHKLLVTLKPVSQKVAQKTSAAVSSSASMVDTEKIVKILKVLSAVLLAFFVLYVGFRLFTQFFGKSDSQQNQVVQPTLVPYRGYKESIYAKDKEMLILEEKAGILDREIQNAQLKETQLNPPVLDFDMNFKID